MNLPKAAKNAGLTNKEMKITFNEYWFSSVKFARLNNLTYCQTEEDRI